MGINLDKNKSDKTSPVVENQKVKKAFDLSAFTYQNTKADSGLTMKCYAPNQSQLGNT